MPLPRHLDLAHLHDSSQADPWQLRLGPRSKVCAEMHLDEMHSATGCARGEVVFWTHPSRHSSLPHGHDIAQSWAVEHSPSAMHASTLLAHLSDAHWQVSLQVAASQSTPRTFAERRLLKHLFWTHSIRGVANGDADNPAQFNRQASSPQSH